MFNKFYLIKTCKIANTSETTRAGKKYGLIFESTELLEIFDDFLTESMFMER